MHRPEFPAARRDGRSPCTLLNESTGPRESSFTECNRQKKWSRQNEADGRGDHADDARDDFGGAVIAEALRQNEAARIQRLDRHFSRQPLVVFDRVFDDDATHAPLEQELKRQAMAAIGKGDDDPFGPFALDDFCEPVEGPQPSGLVRPRRLRFVIVDDAGQQLPQVGSRFHFLDELMGPDPSMTMW